MKRSLQIKAVILVLLLGVGLNVQSKLSQPDYVLYGTATWFGGPLANGAEISIYLENQLLTVAEYKMGTEDNLSGLYALRVPMDGEDPRTHGTARPGDPASLYINGSKVADVLVGGYGVAQRLDIDPINTTDGSSIISVLANEIHEGHAGTTEMNMLISLSEPATEVVSVDWATTDGTAIGGDECIGDVDYLSQAGTVSFQVGSRWTHAVVSICGDTLIEQNEYFEVLLSDAQNGVIQFDRAAATILDDDGLPQLTGHDLVVFEPSDSPLTKSFEFQLSRAYEQAVSFSYEAIGLSATAGSDFNAAQGNVTIAAGETSVTVEVTFLPDANNNEGIEVMQLEISNVTQATTTATTFKAFIMDSGREEELREHDQVDQNQVADLINPADVVFSPDGQHVYVSTLSVIGSILHFSFDNGTLAYQATYTTESVGFDQGKFQQIRQLLMSDDGQHLYAAASGDNALMVLSRDVSTGELSYGSSFEGSIENSFGLEKVYDLVLAPGGGHLYVAGSDSDAVSVFSVNPSDGSLGFLETEAQGVNDPSDNGPTVTFLDRPVALTVSPDGKNLYVAADHSSSLAVFSINQNSGKLVFRESFKNATNGISGLAGAGDVQVTPDGEQVMVLGRNDNQIASFTRGVNGFLNFQQSYAQSNLDFIGMESPVDFVFNAEGENMYVAGFNDSSVVSFLRISNNLAPDFGQLSFADIDQNGVNGLTQMAGPNAIALSPNAHWLAVAASTDNAIKILSTKAYDLIYKSGFEAD